MATNSMECNSGDLKISSSEKPHSGENCKQMTDTTTCQFKPVEEMLAVGKPTEPVEPLDIDIDEDAGNCRYLLWILFVDHVTENLGLEKYTKL